MKKYVVIYHAPRAAMENMPNDPDKMKEGMAQWMAWAKKCGAGMVDLGTPLGGGTRVAASGTGPSKREVVGYSILQAENLEAAKKMLDGHPHLHMPGGCEIEIHESLPLPA
ncbi:MAG: YciI family protein [Ignavibacteria bacterium]|nr:YciI family protein [Ignavibacteria bacterium]